MSGADKKPEASSKKPSDFGLGRFKNSTIFSDITIEYGGSGAKRTFHGHRVVLCMYSRWFQAALAGGFKVCYHTSKPSGGDKEL